MLSSGVATDQELGPGIFKLDRAILRSQNSIAHDNGLIENDFFHNY